ncbi:Quinone oxidoreductase, partial [Tetrabaena socialis]
SGLYPLPASPFTPGVEGAGVVAVLGAGVEGLAVGDRVAYITRPPCGSYGEFCAVPYGRVVRTPAGLSSQVAAASMIQGMTATALVTLAYPVKAGDTVLVTAAAGGTGGLVAQLASAAGATVIGTASTPEKAEIARQAGCAHVILYTEQDLAAEVLRLTGGRGVAAVYDGVGASTFDAGLACLARLGWMVSYGNASGKVRGASILTLTWSSVAQVADVDILRLSRNNVRLMRPALWGFVETKEDFEALASQTLAAVAEGRLRVRRMCVRVTARYPLERAAEAHRDLESRGTTGKLLLLPPTAAAV